MDYLGKGEVLTNTDLDRFVNNIWENAQKLSEAGCLKILSWLNFFFFYSVDQFWGNLLLKVMHYNIALIPKKVTNYLT